MTSELFQASEGTRSWRWFRIRVEHQEDRWVATCEETDREGAVKPGAPAVAPKFYGVSEDQARRRMLDALENTYDEVTPVTTEGSG